MNEENKMEKRLSELVRVPLDLYVTPADVLRMSKGEEGIGYIEVSNTDAYKQISKHAFQPAIQLDNNTYKVTFILK